MKNMQATKSRLVVTAVALSALTALALANLAQAQGIADELSVQGASSTNGDATTLRGRIGGPVDFSVTGRFADIASVRTGNGTTIAEVTIRDIWNNNGVGPVVVRDKVQLPDGRSRLFLRITNSQAAFNGGQVRLRSGYAAGLLLDADPIQLQ